MLIEAADTLKTIVIDIDQDPNSILGLIEHKLNTHICDKLTYFGLHYDTETDRIEE